MRILFAFAAAVLSLPAGSTQLTPLATATDLNLEFTYVARGGPGPCGAAWFALEGLRWVCFDRSSEDIWQVTQMGRVSNLSVGYQLLRGPLAGGDRLLLFNGVVYGLQLGGSLVSVVGNLPSSTFPVGTPQLVDAQGDGIPEAVLGATGSTQGRMVSLPDFSPISIAGDLAWFPPFALTGQFDGDPAGEVARFATDAIEFLDANSNSVEAYQVNGTYAHPSLAFQGDGDPALEVVARIAGTESVALIDLGATPIPLDVSDSGMLIGFAPLDWSGDAQAELAVLWDNRILVVDPRTGAFLASFTGTSFSGPLRSSHRFDWGGDGDEDVILRANSYLLLLENPQGPRILQYGAGEKRPIAATTHQGSPAVAIAEAMANGVYLVLRDAETLTAIQRLRIEENPDINSVRGGDFSAHAGIEAIYTTPTGLHVRRVADGTSIWTRPPPGAGRYWVHPVVATGPCNAASCRRVLATDSWDGIGSAQPSYLRMLDGDSGTTLWSMPIPTLFGQRAAALGDINGDNVPDAVLGQSVGSQSDSLMAVDGASGNILWQRLLPAAAVDVAISTGRRQRLAILDRDSTVNILLATTGDIVASRRMYAFPCDIGSCSLAYVGRPGFPGEWAVRAPSISQNFVREDLRQPTATMRTESFRNAADVGPGRALVGTSDSLILVETPAEELFVDHFEDW